LVEVGNSLTLGGVGINWVSGFLKSGDWSGYDYLWLDVTSPDKASIPWLFIEDGATFSPYIRFEVPAGQTVTLSVPLAKVAAFALRAGEGELKLSDIRTLYYFNEAGQGVRTYLDNLRLARKGAPRPAKLVEPTDLIPPDMGWRDAESAKVPPIPKRDIPRVAGPVEPLGPITLPKVDWGRQSAHKGAFGEGGDYGTPNVRGVVAYDNKRLAVVLGARWIFASFDNTRTISISVIARSFLWDPNTRGEDGSP